ncbi:exocyst complex component Sec3 [Cladophialophora carrionii]|uniref:Exocyst complex component Sec3 n=1 Tax=Cladophialophora carrionii TaxID=86049 RepID=A0A1C1CI79_9EURO|nr:exocyst complex component Sec3 [Cladophialophora carrionii]
MNQQPMYGGPRQATPLTNGAQPRQNGRPGEQQESNQSRAARFEDEKQRIIEACFSKRDPEGMQLESYITHVRVLEDASYPSSPPPPDSPPSNKKHRVILVAVRRSGKVRVHKARENPNGSFSIGKTWNLDELTAIISYSSLVPANPQQQMEKQWASNTGFTVSLGKPYFWAAATAKEKDFFIASLIKIYRKYTGGKVPELIGFAPQEVQQLAGVPPSQNTPTTATAFSPIIPNPTPPPPGQQRFSPPPVVPAFNNNRPQSPYAAAQPPPSRDGPRIDPHEQRQAFGRQEFRPPTREQARPPSSHVEERERGVGLPPRPIRRVPPPEESRNQPYAARLTQEDARMPSLADTLQPAPLRPSLSPKASQSSLERVEPSLEPQPLRPNGLGVTTAGNRDFSPRRAGPTPGQDLPRDVGRNEQYGGSRPSTATSDRRTPDPPPSLPPILPGHSALESELYPEQKKPTAPPARADLRPEQPGPASQSHSAFVTPQGTPGATKDEELQRKPDYFANEKPEVQGKQSQADVSVPPPIPVYAQVTTPEPEALQSANEPASPESANSPAPPKTEEEFRPGLGPMVKKKSGKDIANQFRKAALAAAAFQPRQGGAGARLKAMQDKLSNEPDGVTSVVPAPLKRGMSGDSARSGTPDIATPDKEKDQPGPKLPPKDAVPQVQIERTATSDSLPRTGTPAAKPIPAEADGENEETKAESPEKVRSASPQKRRRQRLEAEVEKHCTGLGIDPRLTDGEGADLDELMTQLGWEGKLAEDDHVDKYETDIHREIGRAQASGWLGHVEQQESKVLELATAFDKAIAECEELDGLLTLYAHELDTLHEDIEYIEAQGQGLQVQTANQKLLQASLNTLLKTLSISPSDLRALQSAPIDSYDGVTAIEGALALLYDAMLTIDPELGQNKLKRAASTANRLGLGKDPEARIDKMRAVREKKDEYKDGSMMFVNRINQHMKMMFSLVEQRTSEENASASVSSGTSSFTLNLRAYNASRQELWVYNAMMLFVREVNQYEWQVLISSYERNFNSIYQEQFRDFAENLKRTVRQPTGEEQELLFTHQERERPDESNLSTAARKLTVKGRKPVKASTLRQSFGGDRRDGKPDAWTIFDTVLEQQALAISEEQNFIVHFFHLNSQAAEDFVEVIRSQTPEQRKLPNLQAKLPYDPDRNMAKIVQNTTDGIYSFWPSLLQGLMEWVLRLDSMQGVGVLVSLEQCLSKYEETNQEFIARTVRTLHDRITGLFHKFVEEQVRAIEETKVKVKKRKGLISFMRVFPEFVAAVEEMIPPQSEHQDSLEVRFIVNDAYKKILKAMWESLNFIAKDNPAANAGGQRNSSAPSSGDPEDKEALNYHILLIENMAFFAETISTHNNVVLEEWVEKAGRDQLSHLTQYTDAVIRRPLGKWLDFLESTEALMNKGDGSNVAIIAKMPSHSRSTAKKMLGNHDAREIRKGVELLRKRVEKHFAADDGEVVGGGGGSGNRRALVERVFDECSVRYAHAWDRMKVIIEKVYDGNLEMDWRKDDVQALFKR